MQATVVKVAVKAGDSVLAGDLLLVLEAMKMEQPVIAPSDGVVEKVSVSVGDSVVSGFPLCFVTPLTES
jgi:acetyl-CoA/propionyl-CoA carboxylase biotin carboxyl carrier protein